MAVLLNIFNDETFYISVILYRPKTVIFKREQKLRLFDGFQ
jgi:hypothetical protein